MTPAPDRIQVGAGVILLSVNGLSIDWGIPESGVRKTLTALQIPLIRFPEGEKSYVSLYSLESALFAAGLSVEDRDNKAMVKLHHELAGVLYGTLTREVIRNRVKEMARALRSPGSLKRAPTKKKPTASKKKSATKWDPAKYRPMSS